MIVACRFTTVHGTPNMRRQFNNRQSTFVHRMYVSRMRDAGHPDPIIARGNNASRRCDARLQLNRERCPIVRHGIEVCQFGVNDQQLGFGERRFIDIQGDDIDVTFLKTETPKAKRLLGQA